MSVQLRKVFRDLWIYRIRTGLSIFAISAGLIVFGGIATTRTAVVETYYDVFQQSRPAQVIMQVAGLDEGLIRRIENVDGIRQVDARYVTSNLRISVAPNNWIGLDLHASDDYGVVRLHRIFAEPETIGVVPIRETIWLDRSIQLRDEVHVGDMVLVETSLGDTYELQVSGFVNDLIAFPSNLTDKASGYISQDTLRDLRIATFNAPAKPAYNQLFLRFDSATDDVIRIRQIIAEVEDVIQTAGYKALSITYLSDAPPLDAQIGVIDALLIFSTIMTFGVTGVMISNFVSAIVGRQSSEIAIMKSLGAVPGQIITYFSMMMVILGIVSFIISFPVSEIVAQGLSEFLATTIDVDVGQVVTPLDVRAFQFVSALLIPLTAAFFPVLRGSFITVRDTLRSDGNATGTMARWLLFLPQLFSPLLVFQMAIRNVFLKPWRFLLIVISLTVPGALFIASFGVNSGLQTLDASLADSMFNYDIELMFDGTVPIKQILRIAQKQDGVAYAEAWRQGAIHRVFAAPTADNPSPPFANGQPPPDRQPPPNRPPPNGQSAPNRPPPDGQPPNRQPTQSGSEALPPPSLAPQGNRVADSFSGEVILRGVPRSSQLIRFSTDQLIQGTWLQDTDDLVLTSEAYEAFSLNVDGSNTILVGTATNNDEQEWDVMGVTGQLLLEEGFVDIDTFERFIPLFASSIRLAVVTHSNDSQQINQIIENLRDTFNQEGIHVNASISIQDFVAQRAGRLNLITQTLTILAVMIEVVSVIGLISTISINVRERTKSIGILRSLGGNYQHLISMIITESMVIVLTSYALALLFSFTMGDQISVILGTNIYALPAKYIVVWESVVAWFVIMVVIGLVAALSPAIYAINVTISDTLRYEG